LPTKSNQMGGFFQWVSPHVKFYYWINFFFFFTDNGNPVERVNKNNMDADDVKSSQDNSCPRTPTSLFDRSELLTPSRKRWENDNIPE
jgi:hypothetical protein